CAAGGSYWPIGPDGRYLPILTRADEEGRAATLVNGDNGRNFYSFHPSGAQAAMCDGSVRFIASTTDWRFVASMVTAENQDPTSEEAWK
ncbi:MAG: H-X9-DG-CTERM domain-containing protein, partial [Pirellulales bacterium]